MNNVYVCTAGDYNYFNTDVFNLCLKSYSFNSCFPVKVFLVDEKNYDVNSQKIQKVFIDWNQIKSKNSNKCIQHGEFARFLNDVDDEDVIIFTDGDIILQRGFTENEKKIIYNLNKNTFLANYNLHYNSNMYEVLDCVGGNKSDLESFVKKYFSSDIEQLKNYKEMNTGVLIARKKDFIALSDFYNQSYDELKKIISGYWNQQFLINLIINKYFIYEELNYSFHTHSHHSIKTINGYTMDKQRLHGVPHDVYLEDGVFKINKEIILFAHKL